MERLVKEGVYILFKDGEAVYIGQSQNVYSRIGEHARTKDFDSFSVYETQEGNKQERNRLEKFLIESFSPPENVSAGIGLPDYRTGLRGLDLLLGQRKEPLPDGFNDFKREISTSRLAMERRIREEAILEILRKHSDEIPTSYTLTATAKGMRFEKTIDADWLRRNEQLFEDWLHGDDVCRTCLH